MQDFETPRTFHDFTVYRDLGPTRTHEQVAEIVGKALVTIRQTASENDWASRIRKWEQFYDAERRRQNINARIASDRQHMAIGTRVLTAVEARLVEMAEKGEPIKQQYMAALLNAASKLQREGLGNPKDESPVPDSLAAMKKSTNQETPTFG